LLYRQVRRMDGRSMPSRKARTTWGINCPSRLRITISWSHTAVCGNAYHTLSPPKTITDHPRSGGP
jgi:hypothetical protein